MNKILSLLVISSAVSAVAMEMSVERTISDSNFCKETTLKPTGSALGAYCEEMDDLNYVPRGAESFNLLTEIIQFTKDETVLNNEEKQRRRACSSFDFGLVTPSTQNEEMNTLAPTGSAVVASAQAMEEMNAENQENGHLSSSSTGYGPEYSGLMSLEF